MQSGRIYDIFSLAGKVTWVDLQLDKDGRSKGMAVVQYSHPIESVQAISMLHNQRLYDREINVRMDRFEPEEKRDGELPAGLRGVGMGLGANGAPLGDVTAIISSLGSLGSSAPQSLLDQVYSNPAPSGYPSPLPFPSSSTYPPIGVGSSFPASNAYGSPSLTGNGGAYNPSRSILIKNVSLCLTYALPSFCFFGRFRHHL